MKYYSENLLLFFAAIQGHDEFIRQRTDEIIRGDIDWEYLQQNAAALGIAGGLIDRLLQAEKADNDFISQMRKIMKHEIQKTVSMLSLYKEISSLFKKYGFSFIPLKGCDSRIAKGARNVFNVMEDIDILVKISDVEDIGNVLEENGYYYQGSFSGSHMNFFTDEAMPRLIEIHWDLINRASPVNSRLFQPSIDAVWERSIILCDISHLSTEDLLSYLVAHSVKEYFHKPKWLADIAWVIENFSSKIDPAHTKIIMTEWGTSKALGIISSALKALLDDSDFDVVWDLGALRPGLIGSFVAKRVVCYHNLRMLRPLIFMSSADTLHRTFSVTGGVIERSIRELRKKISKI